MLALLFLSKLTFKNGQYLQIAAEYVINKLQWGEGGVLEKVVQCPIFPVKVQSITL